jgi:KipI family sensor histidine kinase inhibitor
VIRPFGEAAFLVELGDVTRVQAVAASMRREPLEGMTGVVAGRESVLVEFEVDHARAVEAAIGARIAGIGDKTVVGGRLRHIPVVYDGPDLEVVAALVGLTTTQVVELHASIELRVLFGGFAPGFAYLGELPEALTVPRLATPRTRTPAGSVALAGGMSGIYPADLPGGWRVIGWTPLALFDAGRTPPAYLAPGDRIRFVPINRGDADRYAGPAEDW